MLTPERYAKISSLFKEASALQEEERDSFLLTQCGDDSALILEVKSLLAHAGVGGILDGPALADSAGPDDEEVESRLQGARIGAYELVKKVASGGMGTVWRARRADGQFEQEVAIKLIKRGMDTDDMLKRFRNERQALANLQHPNIAGLFDGGATSDGLPFLVMEFVEGETIDKYCEARNLPLDERLELFCQVCHAVEFAHRNLIVHRDLKPSNILVTPDGVPKLLDFGIAKILDRDGNLTDQEITLLPSRLMTPQYASPEQVRGEPITTASDVYSLGVLLYVLLTGQHPYRMTTHERNAVEMVICEETPPKPSTAVARLLAGSSRHPTGADGQSSDTLPTTWRELPRKLPRRLSGDLDNIVLTALRKEPSRRYASVEKFSEDIQRYLAGMPVMAQTDTLGYRTGKFVLRHVVGVVACSAILLALLGGLATTTWQMRVAAQERAKMQRINDFLQGMLSSVRPDRARGENVSVEDVLEEAVTRLDTRMDDQPEIEAALRNTIGVTYMTLGRFALAEPLITRALELQLEHLGERHGDTMATMGALGRLRRDQGNLEEAERILRRTLELRTSVMGPESREALESMRDVATVAEAGGKLQEAEDLYRKNLEIHERIGLEWNEETLPTINNLAYLLKTRGNTVEAEEMFRKALAASRDFQGDDHPGTLTIQNNLAGLLKQMGKFAEAEPIYRHVVEALKRVEGEDHPHTLGAMNNLAGVLEDQGDHAEAVVTYRFILQKLEPTLGNSHQTTLTIRHNLALALKRLGNLEESVSLFDVLLVDTEAALTNEHWITATFRIGYGDCLTQLQRYADAEVQLVESHSRLTDKFGAAHIRTTKASAALIRLYQAWGKPDKAAAIRGLSGSTE